MVAISLFFKHRSKLLPWMLQGTKVILVSSRCTLLLFCEMVIGPVVGDSWNKCCCRKRRTQQGLWVGCVLLYLLAGSPVWAQRQSTGLWPSSEKFRSPLSWEDALLWGEERTHSIKNEIVLVVFVHWALRLSGNACTSCWVVSALKAVASTQRVTERDGLTPTELFHWGFWGIQMSNFFAAKKPVREHQE